MIRQIWRGMYWMPYVGEHPGNAGVLIFTMMGAAAGGLIGAAVMLVFFGPMYCYGAYDRAQLSDRMSKKAQSESN